MSDGLKYLLILAIIAAVFSTAGVALFGLAAVSAIVVGALIGIFIPAIFVIVGLAVMGFTLIGRIPFIPGTIVTVVMFLVAWVIATLPGGGF